MSHKKFGPDQFSRFGVYWMQTNKHYYKSNLYIDSKLPLDIKRLKQMIICPIHIYVSDAVIFKVLMTHAAVFRGVISLCFFSSWFKPSTLSLLPKQ